MISNELNKNIISCDNDQRSVDFGWFLLRCEYWSWSRGGSYHQSCEECRNYVLHRDRDNVYVAMLFPIWHLKQYFINSIDHDLLSAWPSPHTHTHTHTHVELFSYSGIIHFSRNNPKNNSNQFNGHFHRTYSSLFIHSFFLTVIHSFGNQLGNCSLAQPLARGPRMLRAARGPSLPGLKPGFKWPAGQHFFCR